MEIDLAQLEEIQAALIRRDFGLYCEMALAPLGMKPAKHHRLIIHKLQQVAEGQKRRVMFCMPPGSAKSTYVSRLFPSWYFGFRASLLRRSCIIAASHTADLAEGMSRDVQSYVRDMSPLLGYGLANESVKGWLTTNRDEYKAAGVGGPITGRRADVAIIDDPVKDRAAADSETERENVWRWFTSTLRTRLKPGGSIVLVMTRWHEDDLGGRLLATQRDMWDVVSLPAQAIADDPLGREPGEWLWGDDAYNYAQDLRDAKAEAERSGAMRDWGALYQQDPRPSEGALFKVSKIGVVPAMPPAVQIVRAWDLAATEQMGTRDPDWTAGVKLARIKDGRFCICHVERERGGPDDTTRLIQTVAQQDGRGVQIGLPQDPGQAGKFQVAYITRQLTGFRVESSPESGDKATRAGPFASQVNVGNVLIVGDGPNGELSGWARRFLDELGAFPSGTKDDQVDAASRAFMMVGAAPKPMFITDAMLRQI